MKQILSFAAMAILLAGCAQTEDEKAAASLAKIDSLYAKGKYSEALDSITSLRAHYPAAINARKHALKVWQDASLKMAQADVAATDMRLQQTLQELENATSLLQRNMLAYKRDSLQARYEAMCGVVRMIHMRQKQDK